MPNKFLTAVNSSTERDTLIDTALPGVAGICFRRDINSIDIYDNDAAAWISLVAAGGASQYVAVGSSLGITVAAHNGKTLLLDTAAGSTVTLPAATGSGAKFRFLVTVIATTNSHKVQVANSTDVMIGMIQTISDDAGNPVKGYTADATAGADTITLNRTTTGSTVKGEWIEVEDVASGIWAVRGTTASTGTEATPFTAAV